MDCNQVREHLLGHQRNQLTPELREGVTAHLDGCSACRHSAAADAELSNLLERQLPQHPASIALKRRLALRLPAVPVTPAARKRRRLGVLLTPAASALAAAALVLVTLRTTSSPLLSRRSTPTIEMVNEAVNDHLRVVQSTHPVEIESGGIHQVKPWFTGRLDFAPRVSFSGDNDFPLVGGSVGYFRDRKTATFVFKRRLHTVSLFIFRADGLPWRATGLTPIGRLKVEAQVWRGFSVLLWQDGELGYCLVSDVSRPDLELLATKISGQAP